MRLDSAFTPNANDDSMIAKLRNSMYSFTNMSRQSTIQNDANKLLHTSVHMEEEKEEDNPAVHKPPSILSSLINKLCDERINPTTKTITALSSSLSVLSPTALPMVMASSSAPTMTANNPKSSYND